MDISRLDRLSEELQEAEWLERRLEELSTEHITAQLTGMPRGFSISNPTQTMAVLVADLRIELQRQYEVCMFALIELTKFIGSIEDPEMRQIFRYRFIECKTYTEIARIKNYSDHSVVWKKVQRYLNGYQKHQKQCRTE